MHDSSVHMHAWYSPHACLVLITPPPSLSNTGSVIGRWLWLARQCCDLSTSVYRSGTAAHVDGSADRAREGKRADKRRPSPKPPPQPRAPAPTKRRKSIAPVRCQLRHLFVYCTARVLSCAVDIRLDSCRVPMPGLDVFFLFFLFKEDVVHTEPNLILKIEGRSRICG